MDEDLRNSILGIVIVLTAFGLLGYCTIGPAR